MDSQKCIFIHINKCGGTSVRKVLNKIKSEGADVTICTNNIKDSEINISDVQKWSSYGDSFSFTIVRHPFARFISAYKMIKRDIKDVSYTIDDFIKIVTNPSIPYGIGGGEEYIKRHTLPMTHPHYSIVDKRGLLKVKFVAELEKIDQDWKIIQEKLGINYDLPKANATSKETFKLNQSQEDILYKYYQRDFEIFKYDPKNY